MLWFPVLCFYGIYLRAYACDSVYACFLGFSLVLIFCFSVWSCFCLYFIYILINSLNNCIPRKEKETKGVDLGGWGSREALQEVRRGETLNRICYIKVVQPWNRIKKVCPPSSTCFPSVCLTTDFQAYSKGQHLLFELYLGSLGSSMALRSMEDDAKVRGGCIVVQMLEWIPLVVSVIIGM